MFKVCLVIFAAVLAVNCQDVVNTSGGQIRGVRMSTGVLSSMIAFKGIPYAEPPVGALRFRNPVPHRGWSGIRDGSEHGDYCPSDGWFGVEPGGSEDCLFLNVYTPSLVGARAVMFWIHGGSFTGGNGNSWTYGPDLLVNDGVVVVTINYRLGALGFLGTGDGASQGNYGMKDMVEALRWVRQNIHLFGGNPNEVTVFGESAGGVAIHYMMLSQMSTILFQRAISQSGTALVPWAFQPNPRDAAVQLARSLQISFTTNQNLVDQLRNIPFQRIVDAQGGWTDLVVPRGFSSMDFVPCVEPVGSPEARFLTDTPRNLMRSGNILRIPFMMGYMSMESLFMIREVLIDDSVMNQFAINPHFFVPLSFNLQAGSAASNEVATAFRQQYFNGAQPSQAVRFEWTQYNTDHHFAFGIDRTIRYHSTHQTQPAYYYRFSFDGALNMIKRLLLLTDYPGAVHADDIFYMFDVASFPMPVLPTNHAFTVRRRVVRLWTNFARFGNPTPSTDSLITTIWPRYTTQNQEFLDIGTELTSQRIPMNGRLTIWNDFQVRFDPL